MRFKLLVLALLLSAIAVFCIKASSAKADTVQNWINTSELSLEKIRDLSTGELPPYSINGNRDCVIQKIITRPARLVPPQSEQNHQSCIVDTAYGAYSTSGYLQRQSTNIGGQLRLNSGNLVSLTPVPRSNTSIRFGAIGANGVNLLFIKNFGGIIKSSAIFTGEVTHNIPPEYTSGLKDKAGNTLWAQQDSISFSANGKWMIVDTSFIGTVRVNLETFEILPFGPAYNYNIGLTPGIQSAISSDGRYAVLFSKVFGRFRIYDLSTCSAVPNSINGPVNCQSRDLMPFIQSQITGFSSVSTIRFISSDSISLYASRLENGVNKSSFYVMRVPGSSIFSFDYLALGDSYVSGEGAFQYKALTDTSENKCHLSVISYPYLIGQSLNFNKYESVACSGAEILDIIGSEFYNEEYRQAKGKEKSEFDNEIINGLLPGYRAQFEFPDHYKPSIISLTAIGNDIGFSKKVMRCLEPDTCFETYEDRLEVVRHINNQFNKLANMFTQIKTNKDPRTKIYAVGYPQIAKPGGECAINVRLDNDELEFTELLITYINDVVELAAQKAGVNYVDIENAFYGYRLCETDSWNVAVHGLTAGNDIIKVLGGPIGHESYHPTAFGQWLIKQKVLAQTNNFSLPSPLPNVNVKLPSESAGLPILQAPKSNRSLNAVSYDDDVGNDIMYRNGVWKGFVSVINTTLKPLSVFKAVLHSDPIELGPFTSDQNGNLSLEIEVPASAPVGYHTLHLFGKTATDESVDIQKTIFIAGSQDDYNSNGLVNEIDPCPFGISSLVDEDADDIDDACDGFINQAPPPPIIDEPVIDDGNQIENSPSGVIDGSNQVSDVEQEPTEQDPISEIDETVKINSSNAPTSQVQKDKILKSDMQGQIAGESTKLSGSSDSQPKESGETNLGWIIGIFISLSMLVGLTLKYKY